jgi:putative sigma-54 modulation protein
MRVFIQTHGLNLSREEREHISQRLHKALSRFGAQAIGATLHLSDSNGPRGGDDKDCHLVVELEGATTVVRDRGHAVRAVVDRAVHRAVQAVGRQLDHMRSRTQRSRALSRVRQEAPRKRRIERALMAMPDSA